MSICIVHECSMPITVLMWERLRNAAKTLGKIAKFPHYTVPPLYCTHTILYPHCTVPTLYCTPTILYPHCTVPPLYCTPTVLYPHYTVPPLYCTPTILYPHCTVPTLYLPLEAVHLVALAALMIAPRQVQSARVEQLPREESQHHLH
jgi:hypothetical protein